MVELKGKMSFDNSQAEKAMRQSIGTTENLTRVSKIASNTASHFGTRVMETSGNLGQMRVSGEKVGIAMKNLASVLIYSTDPVDSLTQSFSYLTRAFKVGVPAIIGVMAASEAIRMLNKRNQELNDQTDKLNAGYKEFERAWPTLNLEGARSQVESITKQLEAMNDEATKPTGFMAFARGVSDIMNPGQAKERMLESKKRLEDAREQAKVAATQKLEVENNLKTLEKTDPVQAKINRLFDERTMAIKKANEAGYSQIYIKELERKYSLELLDLEEERKRVIEERKKKEAEAATKALDELIKLQQAGKIPYGEANVAIYDAMMARKTGERTSAAMLASKVTPEAVSGLAQTEQMARTTETEQLLEEISGIRTDIMSMVDLLKTRLGVPILRTAY